MSDRDKQANAQPRGFTNDGKVSSEIVNDSYGTVDPADSTGLDDDAGVESQPGAAQGRSESAKSGSGGTGSGGLPANKGRA